MDPPITFLGSRPSLEVGDLGATLAFLADVVGFEVAVAEGEPPVFAIVGAGPSEIGLVEVDEPAIPAGAACYVDITGLDALVERIAAAGIEHAIGVTERPWGSRDIVVTLPGEGPMVAFGEAIGA